MRHSAWFAGCILGLVGFAGTGRAAIAQPAALRGQVVSAGGRPLSGAVVRITQGSQATSTDAAGWFVWPGPPAGRWDIAVSAIGFRPAVFSIEVGNGALTPRILQLEAVAQPLESLTIRAKVPSTARLAGFARRRLVGLGRYFGEGDIARIGAVRTSSLLRMLPAGIRVQDSLGTPLAVSNRGQKLVQEGGRSYVVPCVLRTAIDGQVQPWGTSLDVVDPTEIIGIEVYLGASSIPAEFAAGRRDQFCGLIVIWTR